MRLSSLLCLAVLVLGSACGDDGDKAPVIASRQPSGDRDGGPERDASDVDAAASGTGGTSGSDGGGAGSGGSDDGPLIEFTAPAEASDAEDDTVITTAALAVRCKVSKLDDGPEVDRSSVTITLVDPRDDAKTIMPPVDALADGEHEAKFELHELPNGPLTFHCSARDLAPMPATSSAAVSTLLDLGPKIEFVTPQNGDQLALKTPVAISFRVTPQPLQDDDGEAAVAAVSLRVVNREFEIEASEDDETLYQTTINFGDTELFDVAPETAELTVTAVDKRTPEPATRSSKIDIKVDGEGPRIVVESPTDGQIVRGEVTLRITIIDDSGVTTSSVRAEYGSLLNITQWEQAGTSFTAKFDTRTFPSMLTQIPMQISATDSVGNETTVDHSLKLDNFPPVLSLDPPVIREVREPTPGDFFCSTVFDPVGASAIDDKGHAPFSPYFRVLIEDRTGTTTGQMADYHAGVRTDSVEVFAQRDTSKPFLIDSNADGTCDEIAFDQLPPADRPAKISLTAIVPQANAYYPPARLPHPSMPGMFIDNPAWDGNNTESPHDPGVCLPDPNGALEPPSRACGPSEMSRVVHGRSAEKPPAVYAFMPKDGVGAECTGTFWQVTTLVGDGWKCVAARAEDNIGNVGVSQPLRVCFNDGVSANGTPTCDEAELPTCMSSCTITPAQLFSHPDDQHWLL